MWKVVSFQKGTQIHFFPSAFKSIFPAPIYKVNYAYPKMWKCNNNWHQKRFPSPDSLVEGTSGNGQQRVVILHGTYWSANFTQRSRLFICVETNSWCMLVSVTASAIFSVNSAQLLSGMSISAKELSLCKKCLLYSTFQFHICLWWIYCTHDFRNINCLKSIFSILLCLLPLICSLHGI